MAVVPESGPWPSGAEVSIAAHVLRLEALALRVVQAFRDNGIEALLLKGPVTNRWLYGDALARRFCDIDLLVPPEGADAARRVLPQLGFQNDHARVLGIHRPNYETSWLSPNGCIDLHTRIGGVPAHEADRAWRRFREGAVEFRLHGRAVLTLDETARTLLLGLHAARRSLDAQAFSDLDLGLTVLPQRLWRQAADLATELGAGSCFVLGLRRTEGGRAMLEQLDYDAEPSLESLLLERRAPQEAMVVAADLGSGSLHALTRAVLRWFRTEEDSRPPLRATGTALLRLPYALLLVASAVVRRRRRVALMQPRGSA